MNTTADTTTIPTTTNPAPTTTTVASSNSAGKVQVYAIVERVLCRDCTKNSILKVTDTLF